MNNWKKQTSQNSSRPPSSDHPYQPPRAKAEETRTEEHPSQQPDSEEICSEPPETPNLERPNQRQTAGKGSDNRQAGKQPGANGQMPVALGLALARLRAVGLMLLFSV